MMGVYHLLFIVDGNKALIVAGSSREALSEICDAVLRLLAVGVVHSVDLTNLSADDDLINGPTLVNLMEQCHSLKMLSFTSIILDENHCRVLGAYSRPDLKIELNFCRIEGAAAEALVEVLRRNEGPTKLHDCRIDNFVLANGLRGNRRLESLKPGLSRVLEVGNQELLAIAGALKESKGLVDLNLSKNFAMSDETWDAVEMSDETWDVVCASLKTHLTLEVLDLRMPDRNMRGRLRVTPDVITSRMQALLGMMKMNLSIHTIHLATHYSANDLFRVSVIPYLETNRFRPRLHAIQRTRPIPYRAKVLGRALMSARTDANRFWMFLSGNAEVAFPSRLRRPHRL